MGRTILRRATGVSRWLFYVSRIASTTSKKSPNKFDQNQTTEKWLFYYELMSSPRLAA
jgi:hypothetical protein